VKWVNKKIINKAAKLPWLEVVAQNQPERPTATLDRNIPEENQEYTSRLKSSLEEVMALYEQTLGYEDEPVQQAPETTENHFSTPDSLTDDYIPLSRLKPEVKSEEEPQTQLQKNLARYHYTSFSINHIPESLKAALNPSFDIFKYTFPQPADAGNHLSQTGECRPEADKTPGQIDGGRENGQYLEVQSFPLKKPSLDDVVTPEEDRTYPVEKLPEGAITGDLPEEDEMPEAVSSSPKTGDVRSLLPVNEDFLLNPLTAQSYYPAGVTFNEDRDNFDEESFDDDSFEEEKEAEEQDISISEISHSQEYPDGFDSYDHDDNKDEDEEDEMDDESGFIVNESFAPVEDLTATNKVIRHITPPEPVVGSFRASVTPEVKTSNQFHIPFNVLHTGNDELDHADPAEVQQIIEKLESTLDQFGIEARVIGMQRGPIITRYEIRIPPGIKVNRILSLTDELAMALEALRVRIEAPIPGRSTVGIEIPNKKRSTVLLGDILNHPDYNASAVRLPLPLGKDIAGNLLLEDLSRMPHILIAGATGSGKSVAINSFITSMIITKSPEEVRMLMVDPKLVELSQYNDIPHLLHPVISDAPKAILALNWAVEEMDRRYEDMADMRARDIVSYNLKVEQHNKVKGKHDEYIPKMAYIVVLIDELGDLMMVAGKEVESSIIRLSQKARAIGIHLILATQRPSVDVITALIKANCPARIALQVAQKTDSRTILDSNGGEQLLGQGDMLFKHPSRAQLIRAQAPYVSDQEVENVVNMVKKFGKPSYIVLEDPKAKSGELELEDENLFDEAWSIIVESQKASASYLQRRLRIGYNRAARIIEAFEARGYIGPQVGSKPREIFIHNK